MTQVWVGTGMRSATVGTGTGASPGHHAASFHHGLHDEGSGRALGRCEPWEERGEGRGGEHQRGEGGR